MHENEVASSIRATPFPTASGANKFQLVAQTLPIRLPYEPDTANGHQEATRGEEIGW